MAVPTITVDWALNANPITDDPYSWTTLCTLGTEPNYFRSLHYERGRENEMNRMETGTGEHVVKDKLSYFDSRNTSSPFYPYVRPMVPIRAKATISGNTYYMFQHYAEDWQREIRLKDTYTERTVRSVDAFDLFANEKITGFVEETFDPGDGGPITTVDARFYPVQTALVRIGAVLDDIGWPASRRNFSGPGISNMQAVTFPPGDETLALEHMLAVIESENGLCFMDGIGNVRAFGRQAMVSWNLFTQSQATFSDNPSGSEIKYQDAKPGSGIELLRNVWLGDRGADYVQKARDGGSNTKFGRRGELISSLTTSYRDLQSQLQWKLKVFGTAAERIASITVMPGTSTAAWMTLLSLDVGSRITVKEQPPGFAAPISADYTIQSLAVDVPPGPHLKTKFVFGLWPAAMVTSWLILDDATFGKLDAQALAY